MVLLCVRCLFSKSVSKSVFLLFDGHMPMCVFMHTFHMLDNAAVAVCVFLSLFNEFLFYGVGGVAMWDCSSSFCFSFCLFVCEQMVIAGFVFAICFLHFHTY